ncbi:MAG: peptidyl-prolyl cis-trans isomerase [Oscillospiraceae bacterium]|jgi:hypothetical protein|nr:peptidyl-prolyl cis-trans isomerase [Oscillospiraceae bacterium]
MSASREKRLRRETKTNGPDLSAKEKQRRQDAFRRAVVVTVSVVVVLAIALLVVSGSGLIPANMKALDIGGVKITGAEFDFHYFMMYYTYGIDPAEKDYEDLFVEWTIQSLTSVVAQSEAARREGIGLTQEDKDRIDETVAALETAAALAGQKPDRMLRSNYGRGITLRGYRAFLERAMLSDRYVTATMASFDRSDAALQGYYEEHRGDYDYIDYHIFPIPGVPSDREEGEYSEEELASYREAQRKKADEMLARVTGSGSFLALSHEYDGSIDDDSAEDAGDGEDGGDGDGDAEEPAETDNTLFKKYKVSDLADSVLEEFLGDVSRKAGDKAVVEDGDSFLVTLFLKRYRDEELSSDVRHILIQTDGYDTVEEAGARAEEILRMWKDGAADEDYFAELAGEYTTDDGSKNTGGLYTGITPSSSYVEPFLNWAVDPSRKPGDTGIVEVDDHYHGFHILYFVGHGDPVWKTSVKEAMDNEEYQARLDTLMENLEAKRNWFGMLFTKSKA